MCHSQTLDQFAAEVNRNKHRLKWRGEDDFNGIRAI
jgi:hypothetical protein